MGQMVKCDIVKLVDYHKRVSPHKKIILIHGCNCQNVMGAGLAKVIATKWPAALKEDNKTIRGDANKLGTWSAVMVDPQLCVMNLYIQVEYGRDKVHVNYGAIDRGLADIAELIEPVKDTVICLIPLYLGCGLAGGDSAIVGEIIQRTFKDIDHYLFYN